MDLDRIERWLDDLRLGSRNAIAALESRLRADIDALRTGLAGGHRLVELRDQLRADIADAERRCADLRAELEARREARVERARAEARQQLEELEILARRHQQHIDTALLDDFAASFTALEGHATMTVAEFQAKLGPLLTARGEWLTALESGLHATLSRSRERQGALDECERLGSTLAARRAELEQLEHALNTRHGVTPQVLASLRSLAAPVADHLRLHALTPALERARLESEWFIDPNVLAGVDRP